jgi:diadenosine tetraphosphate (Ap4A) HIT family hydrolase
MFSVPSASPREMVPLNLTRQTPVAIESPQMPCVFCNEPRDAGEPIFEDEKLLVLLHNDWAVRGHAMIVWRAHVENVAGLTPDDYAHFAAVHLRVERALLDVTGADRAVLLKLGIVTPHLHLHIYPVSATLDRAQVMEIIDGHSTVVMGDEERGAFADDLRKRLA